MGVIIDGKTIAAQKIQDLRSKIKSLGIRPKLAIVMRPGDLATEIYVRQKKKRASEVGISVEVVEDMNKVSPDVDGIIVQLPYPNQDEVIAKIPPEKDVDGLTGKAKFLPATVKAVLVALSSVIPTNTGIHASGFRVEPGMTVGVIGQGRLVGKPLADYLEKNKVKVVRCDEYTDSLSLRNQSRRADILVVATGIPNLIKADMVKPGAIVIDCGSPKPEVDFENVKDIASAITPVPGGVGPMTVVSLLENVFEAATYS